MCHMLLFRIYWFMQWNAVIVVPKRDDITHKR